MKKSMKNMALTALLCSAVSFAGVASFSGVSMADPINDQDIHQVDTGPGYYSSFDMHMHSFHSFGMGIDLTQKQRDAIRSILDKARPTFRNLVDRAANNRDQLRAVEKSKKYDVSKVRSIAKFQGKVVTEMIILRSQVKHDIANVLTAEQKAKLKEMKAHRKGSFHHRHHHLMR